MDKAIWTSDVSRAPGVGALHMASVQMVLSIDQMQLQKGVVQHSNNQGCGVDDF